MENGEHDLVFEGLERNIIVHAIVKNKNKLQREPLGLENGKLNCYANSVLQCLKATEILSSYLSGNDYGETCPNNGDWCLSCCLRRYTQMDLASSTSFYPGMILDYLEELGDDFKKKGLGYEFDATDFLRQVLVKFRSDSLKHPKNQKINDELFGGILQTKFACECEKTEPRNHIAFQLLEIGIKIEGQVGFESLKECMDSYIMKNPSSSPCERCLLPKMSDQVEIVAAPEILIISLGRSISTSGVYEKLDHDVACPMEFDISPYMMSSSERVERKYELYGAIVHEKRGIRSGHYLCYTKYNREWYSISDTLVEPITEEELTNETKQSSILFYRRKLGENSKPHDGPVIEQDIPSRTDSDLLIEKPPSGEATHIYLSDKLVKGRFLNGCLASHQRLLKKYFIVQDCHPLEIIKRINALLEGCTSEEHTFCVPDIGNVIYDYELKAYCHLKGNSSSIYCSTDEATKEKAKEIYELLNDILAHFSDRSVARRGLHSGQIDLYPKKSDKIEGTMDLVCILLRATRWSLGVSLSTKGLIIGPVVLYVNDHTKIDCSGGKSVLIPHNAHLTKKIELKVEEIRFVLILEKDTVMSKLEAERFDKTYNCIVLCGNGDSDVATRGIAHKLAEELQVPVYGLADYNPNGALIILTYKNGSRERAFDNLYLTVPKLQWIGMQSKHCHDQSSGHKRPPRGSTALTEKDQSTLRKLELDLPLDPLDLKSVQDMMQRGFGMSIEQRYPLAGDIINLLTMCIPEMQGNVNQSTDSGAALTSQLETNATKKNVAVEKSDEYYRRLRAQVGKRIKRVTKRQSPGKPSK